MEYYEEGHRPRAVTPDEYFVESEGWLGQRPKCFDDYAEEAGQYVLPRSEKKKVLQKELLGERSQQISLEESFRVYQQLYEEHKGLLEMERILKPSEWGFFPCPR